MGQYYTDHTLSGFVDSLDCSRNMEIIWGTPHTHVLKMCDYHQMWPEESQQNQSALIGIYTFHWSICILFFYMTYSTRRVLSHVYHSSENCTVGVESSYHHINSPIV